MGIPDIPYGLAYRPPHNESPPYAETVEQHVFEWLHAQQLIVDSTFHAQLHNAKFGWLAARCYPYAPLTLLNTIADFITWIFIVDDRLFDRSSAVPYTIISNVSAIWDAPDRQESSPPTDCLQAAWQDICIRLSEHLGVTRFQHFVNGVRIMYGTNAVQIIGHLHTLDINQHDYITLRCHNSGLIPCFNLYGISKGYELSDEERYSPDVKLLSKQANIIISLSNDIYSYADEVKQRGRYENLVCLYISEGSSLELAIHRVRDTIKQQALNFNSLSTRLLNTATPPLQRYISELHYWISGHQQWVLNDTSRYSHVPTTGA